MQAFVNTDRDDDDELVPVMVPKPALPDVTALLHRYYTGAAPITDTEKALKSNEAAAEAHDEEAEALVPQGNGTWTKQDVAKLFRSYSNAKGRTVIDKIAQRSLENRVVYYGELMEHADVTEYQLRSHFGAFSKKGKALKGTEKGCWPMEYFDGGSQAEKGTRYSYRMPRQIARWWLDLSGGADF